MFNNSRTSRTGRTGRAEKGKKFTPREKRLPYRRPIKFQIPKGIKIDYKEINLLQKFISDRGKILSSRLTGVTAKEQRQIARAIKRARFLGLLSATGYRR